MVVTKPAPAGSPVKKDDLLMEVDPQAQMKDYLDKKATYDKLVSQVAQKKAEEDIARAKDDTAMKQAEDELKRAQLELQRNEVVSRIDAEKNQEAADEAQATLKQLKETYQLKRAAAAANIRILEIQRDRAQEAMRYAQSNASKMTVHSPMAGVVVYNTIWLGGRMGTVQQGDQVRAGLPFMAVVDPSQMEVRVELNQVDLLRVRTGLHAKMHLDAYPGIELAATLEDLSPLGHTGQFSETVRVFSARFSIQGTEPRLLPDLSAALDLDLGSEEKALVVPCQSVALESGNSFVWVLGFGAFRLASSTATIPTAEVRRKDFVDTLQIKGEVKALRSKIIAAPYGAGDLQIVNLVANAAKVKKGDLLVEFDATTVKQKLAQDQSSVKSAEAEIQQSRATARLKEEQDLTDVMTAKFNVKKARLDASKQEILSAIDGEQAKLKVADAEEKLKEAEAKLKADRSSAGADLASKKQKLDQAKFQVQQDERSLAFLSLRAPLDGVVALQNHWQPQGGSTPFKPGDRAWPG